VNLFPQGSPGSNPGAGAFYFTIGSIIVTGFEHAQKSADFWHHAHYVRWNPGAGVLFIQN